MLHTEFRENQSAGSRGEDFLRVFTIYGHGGHLGHVINIILMDCFISMYLNAYIQNLVKNGPVVSEKSMFLFSYINGLGPRSRDDLDLKLQYSHTLINSICCLYLPTFRSKDAVLSEKSTVSTFSHRKA